jgi:hypothetical protein
MAHPLQRDFWAGWPAVIVAGYFLLGLVVVDDMSLVEQVIGGLGGGILLVLIYWAIWRVLGWVVSSRQSPQPQPESIDD